MAIQLSHERTGFHRQQFPIVLICDQVRSPANIGSIFRAADSFGIDKIIFCGEHISIISKRMLRTARSTHNLIAYEQNDDILPVMDSLLSEGYELIGLEITESSNPLSQSVFSKDQKIALVIGEENQGISEYTLTKLSKCIHIDMFGNNSSMNVAMATGIVLYEITKQLAPLKPQTT